MEVKDRVKNGAKMRTDYREERISSMAGAIFERYAGEKLTAGGQHFDAIAEACFRAAEAFEEVRKEHVPRA